MLHLQIVGALILAAAGFVGGWQVCSWKAGADAAEQLRADAAATVRRIDQIDGAATGLEKAKETIRVQTRTITREVERLVDRPVYRDRCLDDDGLRLVAAAAAGASAPAGQLAPAVPASAAAR